MGTWSVLRTCVASRVCVAGAFCSFRMIPKTLLGFQCLALVSCADKQKSLFPQFRGRKRPPRVRDSSQTLYLPVSLSAIRLIDANGNQGNDGPSKCHYLQCNRVAPGNWQPISASRRRSISVVVLSLIQNSRSRHGQACCSAVRRW